MVRRSLDQQAVIASLVRLLGARGAQSRADLLPALGISHATLARLIDKSKDEILAIGKARATQYVLKRPVAGLPPKIPVYEVLPTGKGRRFGTLQAVYPRGYHFESEVEGLTSWLNRDLPYFLNDMRPQGYLGRLVPRQHPDLNLPNDIRLWDADTTLRYLSRFGWSSTGNFIVGDEAYEMHLRDVREPRGIVQGKPEIAYEHLAGDILQHGAAGSSAGGEQPKFLVRRASDGMPLIVKFSPPVAESIGRRVADLLVAEHLALDTLAAAGHPASRSNVVIGKTRVFLEVERFDRVGRHGRRGVFSLATLEGEFVGNAGIGDWSFATRALVEAKVVPASVVPLVDRQRLFGVLTANSDMHLYNLSFFQAGDKVSDLTPAYDMQPMYFAPTQNQVVDRVYEIPMPRPAEAKAWIWASGLAVTFWTKLANDKRVSSGFRKMAAKMRDKIESVHELAALLPE